MCDNGDTARLLQTTTIQNGRLLLFDLPAILNFRSVPMSDNVGVVTADSGLVENMGVAAEISLTPRFIPEIRDG